jgi:hypothetical protein
MTIIEQRCQQILDECGYIVIAHESQHPIGAVLHKCETGGGEPFGFPVVVVGYTDAQDFIKQVRSSGTRLTDQQIALEVSQYQYFHKVVAE